MASNQFLPFGTAGGAPVLTQAAYVGITPANAFPAGILPKERLNKALRQSSMMAAALGQMIMNQGFDALDNGVPADLELAFMNALKNFLLSSANFTGVGNQSLGVNGFQKLPGSLILQWGSQFVGDVVSGNGSTGAVVFPTPFTTACYNAVPGIQDASTTVTTAGFVAGPPTLSGFNYRVQEWVGLAQNSTLVWHAIGK